MNRHTLIAEIAHSTAMLRACFFRFATASACDTDCLKEDVRFWSMNRERCRASLNNPLNWSA